MNMRKDPNASQLVDRIRKEVSRRRMAGTGSDPSARAPALVAVPAWKPDLGKLPSKSEYTLAEILQYDGEEFVESAYAGILRRTPDPAGATSFIQALQNGTLSKVEVLGMLRWSEEGEQQGVHVDGLLIPWTIQKWKRVRWIGPLIDWAHTLGRLPRLARAQSLSSARGTREIKRLGLLLNQATESNRQEIGNVSLILNQAIESNREEIGNVAQFLNQAMESSREEIGNALHRLAESEAAGRATQLAWTAQQDVIAARIASLDELVAQVHGAASLSASKLQEHDRQWNDLSSYKAGVDQLRVRIDERLDALEAACTRLSDEMVGVDRKWEQERRRVEVEAERTKGMDFLYAAFEEDFRGSRELVTARIARYMSDISTAASADRTEDLVLDIGCGRGEMLELVRDAGFPGRGIDINEVFVQNCRSLGLDVVKGDAIDMLQKMPDASVMAVTSMHLVEHLPFLDVVCLLKECHRVLRPGGVLILETPNPENILVGSQYFYMDPTHRNPLPPGLLLWLVRSGGFADARVDRLYEERAMQVPELVDEAASGAASMNMVIESFRASLDYAVVARKTA